jgi:hypothetical protein
MKFANLALAVAIGSAALSAPKTRKEGTKIDCKAGASAPSCEVKRPKISARPDLFNGVKPKPKTVHL